MKNFNESTLAEQEKRLAALARHALEAWDLKGSLSLIKQRENAVYALQTEEERYAVRVHRAGYHSDAALNSEAAWLDALDQVGLSVPRMLPTKSGHKFCTVVSNTVDAPRQVDVLAWVDGEQIGSVEEGLGNNPEAIRRIYQTIGEVAAQLHNQASEWNPPDGFERHAWDADGLVGEQPFWGQFWKLQALGEEQRELVLTAKTALYEDLKKLAKTPQNYSLIHADLVPENVMTDGKQIQVIDFDDAGFGWHVFELATVLYFIQDDANYTMAREALIKGYRRHRALSDEDLRQLPMFMAARSLTYLGWVHTRSGTETAIELTPVLVDMCCAAISEYLATRT